MSARGGIMRIDRDLEQLLRESGVHYELERGKRHIKLRVEGRMIQTLPARPGRGSNDGCHNSLAAVRRHLRSIGRLP